METNNLTAIQTTADLGRADRIGAVRARISNRFRMNYAVTPGLHVLGTPDATSPVLVSANYKLSYDALRSSLPGMDAWIVVLDTKGINVWCAAGEGTFGTAELISKIEACELHSLVSHRKIIVPQLGAPGVSAKDVREATGFIVQFGPVRAKDLPSFIAAGYTADVEMRTVTFTVWDRLVLTPMELVPSLKYLLYFAVAVFAVFGLTEEGFLFGELAGDGVRFLICGGVSLFIGAVLGPILLPAIPLRSFALKGAVLMLVPMAAVWWLSPHLLPSSPYILTASALLFPSVSSYLLLNFTGSTTFTNMSGVQKELKVAIPVYLSLCGISLALIIFYKFLTWRT